MVTKGYRLVYNSSIVGFRFKTVDGNYLDTDVDSFGQNLPFSIWSLTKLPLIEHGDILVTQNELDGEHVVDDISVDKAQIQQLRDFLRVNKLNAVGEVVLKQAI